MQSSLTMRLAARHRVCGVRPRGLPPPRSAETSVAATSTAVRQSPTSDSRALLKLQLLERIAGLDRGTLATSAQRTAISVLLKQLEDASQLADMDSTDIEKALAGRWRLIYTTAEVFRSSPFFQAFQQGLVGNDDLAQAIFTFTDAIPGAQVGQALQEFDFVQGTLRSEVDLEVFPGARGVVVTTSSVRVASPLTLLTVTVEGTRVEQSNVAGWLLDQVEVPVKDLIEGVRGSGSTTVTLEVLALDATLRVMRTQDGQVFVYTRA